MAVPFVAMFQKRVAKVSSWLFHDALAGRWLLLQFMQYLLSQVVVCLLI